MNTEMIEVFEGVQIRIVGTPDAPLFVAKDVCDALSISKYRDAASRLDEDERGSATVGTPGGAQQVSCVTESGLYHLIFKSRKAAAKRFRRWVTQEVLPQIRKSGAYATTNISQNPKEITNVALQTLDALIARGITPDKASACISNMFKESMSRGSIHVVHSDEKTLT